MYFDKKCKITYICHGATIYSEEGRLTDTENYPPLSELGVEEMTNVVNYLKARAIKNDVIYSSSAVRTVQSAYMISKLFKRDYEVIKTLTPRKYGCWNGLTFTQIAEKYPSEFKDIIKFSDKKIPQDGESSDEFIERVKKVTDDIVDKNIGNRVIVVTYPEVIQAAICAAIGIKAQNLPKLYIRTGSITQISYFDNWSSLIYSDHVPM